jgi:dTDP-4-amino-4,6-dideoxygalactose transaminase
VLFTFSGSAAIYQAAEVLGLATGDRILFPAYNCGHDLEPLLRRGLDVQYYVVDRKLTIDLDGLASMLRRGARAVLVTHYFGFPQPLAEIRRVCDRHGAALIEDCAHALFSRDPSGDVGKTGDVSVFSPRKTLPLPNGGALVVNNPRLQTRPVLRAPPVLATANKMLELWRKSLTVRRSSLPSVAGLRLLLVALAPVILARRLTRRLPLWNPDTWCNPDDASVAYGTDTLTWAMASIGHRIIDRSDANSVISRRRLNYERLVSCLSGLEHVWPVYDDLPEGTCPLYLPVFCRNRPELRRALEREGFIAANWWGDFHPAVPWEAHPEAVHLKKTVLALPIHQDLDARQVAAMGAALRRA